MNNSWFQKRKSKSLSFLTSDLKIVWMASTSFLLALGKSATKETIYTEYMVNIMWSKQASLGKQISLSFKQNGMLIWGQIQKTNITWLLSLLSTVTDVYCHISHFAYLLYSRASTFTIWKYSLRFCNGKLICLLSIIFDERYANRMKKNFFFFFLPHSGVLVPQQRI